MDATTKGKERLHEASRSGVSSLPTLPSLAEVFSGPSDRHILAALRRSAHVNGVGLSQRTQLVPNIELPPAGYRTPSPPAWERLDSPVSSIDASALRQGHRTEQQATKQGLSDDSDSKVLSQDDHLRVELGTKWAPIDVETHFDDMHLHHQAPIDHGNLSGTDLSVYEDRARLCSNERRAFLQGEGYSNFQLLEKPGQACLKP